MIESAILIYDRYHINYNNYRNYIIKNINYKDNYENMIKECYRRKIDCVIVKNSLIKLNYYNLMVNIIITKKYDLLSSKYLLEFILDDNYNFYTILKKEKKYDRFFFLFIILCLMIIIFFIYFIVLNK